MCCSGRFIESLRKGIVDVFKNLLSHLGVTGPARGQSATEFISSLDQNYRLEPSVISMTASLAAGNALRNAHRQKNRTNTN
jgi:hypothetical protein